MPKYQMTSLWEDDARPEPRFYNNVEQRPVREKPLPKRAVAGSRPLREGK